ncbi:SEC14-like protein 2, partial [Orchesella cincta]
FKSQVHGNVTHHFMKSDLFLLRWIRAKNLDVKRAIRDMFDVIAVGSIGGQWNIRKSALQGKLPRLTRYIFKLVEEVFNRVYDINQQQPNITQFSAQAHSFDNKTTCMHKYNIFSFDLSGLTTYVQMLTIYNKYYPNFAHTITTINTPASFSIVLDLLRPLLNKGTNDALKVFGYDKKQWKEYLDKEISEDQLTEEFGGTRPDDE